MRWPWQRPEPLPTFPCGSCGERCPEPVERHLIGFAVKKDRIYDKFCDGTETPRA